MATKINIGTEINLEDLLQSRMLIQANSGGGKSVLARVIIEETFGKVPFIVMDIEGEYYTLKEKFGDVLIIGGQHADIPISMKSVKLLPREIIGNRLSVVIDLSDLQMSDRILYAKYFLETMMDLPKEYWINYLVFIEEAHKLCGEQDKQVSASAVKDLMSRGRKRGYCGILTTQRIAKLHKDAAAECNNKFVGRTNVDVDMDRAAKELGFSASSEFTRLSLRDLIPGTFYAFGTSIEPHHVHVVKIRQPQTKIVKAGVSLEIKPKAPTEKIKSMLAKLNELPAEAEKELKTIKELQSEVSRLNTELRKSSQNSKNAKSAEDNSKWTGKIAELQQQLKQKDNEILSWKKLAVGRGVVLTKIKNLAVDDVEQLPIKPTPSAAFVKSSQAQEYSTSISATVKKDLYKFDDNRNGKLGKCPISILQFLASFPERSWSKAQVGVASGYSPKSSGFSNAVSELNTSGLIIRTNGKLQIADVDTAEYLGEGFTPQEYSIETFKNKLGKCEREIYEAVLQSPQYLFSKEELADFTPSKYSPTSSGFSNALSTLNTLELIERTGGKIRLNPELLELI